MFSNTQKLKAEYNSKIFETAPVYNIEKAAIQTLNDDYGSLVARRVGSRVAKEVVADQIRQKDSALGAAAWLIMVASERADLRQWSIFPKTFQIVRIPVEPGEVKIKLSGLDSLGNVSEEMPELSFKINSGDIAVRIRRDTNFRDITIRAFNNGHKTELDKIREGYCDWYLYIWTQNNRIVEWIFLDVNLIRASGLFNNDRKVTMNKDNCTGFIIYTIYELSNINGAIVAHYKGEDYALLL